MAAYQTEQEIQEVMRMMHITAGLICNLEIDRYIKQTNHALTIGPFIDPILFMKAGHKAGEWLELAKDLKEFKKKWEHRIGKIVTSDNTAK